MTEQDWTLFEAHERTDYERVSLKKAYVDMVGDLNAGLLLSQIIYWHLSDKQGHIKLRVQHEGYLWLAKTAYEWWDECRLSPKQADRALGILEDRGYIETRLFKFAGSPTKHVRLLKDKFLDDWTKVIMAPAENPFRPKGEIKSTEPAKSLTETTADTTTEDLAPNGASDAIQEKPVKARQPKPRDLLFEAISEHITGVPYEKATKQDNGYTRTVLAAVKARLTDGDTLPTPDEIASFRARYAAETGLAFPQEPRKVADWLLKLRAAQTQPTAPAPDGITAEDLARTLEQMNAQEARYYDQPA